MAKLAWIGVVALAAGCVHTRSLAIGPGAAPLPHVDVRVEHLTRNDAEQRYTEVGVVCISYTGVESRDALEHSRKAVQALADQAAWLGGNVVVPLGLCRLDGETDEGVDGLEYHVYRDEVALAQAPQPSAR